MRFSFLGDDINSFCHYIRCVERNRIKCGTYWPQMPEESNEYGSYLVENIDQNVGKDFTINEFAITNTEVGRWICCFFLFDSLQRYKCDTAVFTIINQVATHDNIYIGIYIFIIGILP